MRPDTLHNVLRVGAGIVLIGVGIPMLVLPGPGLLAIFAGLYLIVSVVPGGKQMVDRWRERYMKWREERSHGR